VTNGPEFQHGPPPIHVVSPSMPSMHGPMQVLCQDKLNRLSYFNSRRKLSRSRSALILRLSHYPPPVTELGVPPSMPMTVPVPISEYSPGSHAVPLHGTPAPVFGPQPYPMTPVPTMGAQPYPVTTVPTMGAQPYPVTPMMGAQPYPMMGPQPYPMTAPPVVIQGGSPRSSRSQVTGGDLLLPV
jgi:hypothetical protein